MDSSLVGIPISIIVSAVGSLLAGAIIWLFKDKIGQVVSALDMPDGFFFGWVMAFMIGVALFIFILLGVDYPSELGTLLVSLVTMLIIFTFWLRIWKK